MNYTLFNPTWLNIKGICFKVIGSIFLLLTLNGVAADELHIGLVFDHDNNNEFNGVFIALNEQNEHGTNKGYKVIFDYSFDCSFEKAKTLITEFKAKIIIGAGNDECRTTINNMKEKNNNLLLVSLFSNEVKQEPNPWLIVLPQSDYLQKKVAEKFKIYSQGRSLDKRHYYRAAYAYDATTTLLRAIEYSNFSLEKLMEEKQRQKLIGEIRGWLKFKVVSVSVAPLRQLKPDPLYPEANKIEMVLEKGERVIEYDKQPLNGWKKVKVFSNPKIKGWIHELLIE
jgi:hypothetical protein